MCYSSDAGCMGAGWKGASRRMVSFTAKTAERGDTEAWEQPSRVRTGQR